ncbi:MAG: hypothetical protein V4654_11620 [Bdellovibrionota bacterium]
MKILLALTAFLVSINVNALTRSMVLDYTNLHGKTNAGLYEISVTFTAEATSSHSSL